MVLQSDNMSNTMKMISNLKENFVSSMVLGLIIFIIIIMLGYIFYIRQLNNRECTFLTNIYGTLDGNIRSINASDPNCQHNLNDYYIKTAYNCCSGGSYKNDFVSTCVLKNILKQGVRGLDFEIYSVNEQPVVATSTESEYYIKETFNSVPFTDVLSTVVNYAFSGSTAPNPDDPIIFHLRIKSTNQKMYENFGNLLESYDSYLLGKDYSFESHGVNLGFTPILTLRGKIIIIVDRINTAFLDNQHFYEFVNMTSNSIFMRALNYYNVKYTPDLNELQDFNRKGMTIAMPDVGSNPPNPNGIVTREAGCQLLAMRYEFIDNYLEENTAMFDKCGYAFCLKPERLRYIPVVNSTPTPQNPELSYATRTFGSDYYNFDI